MKRVVVETAVRPGYWIVCSDSWQPSYKIRSTIVMPSGDAALDRLRADDRVWENAGVISAEETDLPQSPLGELGIEYIAIGR